ncbi:hypothetical protein J4418_03265 [Candidatus Woesearchaeota archaeon]|nr:hypothetical protein [Candidatus Woesearchaeota archaeon]
MKSGNKLLMWAMSFLIFILLINIFNVLTINKLQRIDGLASGEVLLKVISDIELPNITDCSINPKIVIANNSVNLYLKVFDNNPLSNTSIILTLPDNTNHSFSGNTSYNPVVNGDYLITCEAVDSVGNRKYLKNTFIVARAFDFEMDMNQKDNIGVNLEFYYPNSNIKIYTLENYSGNYHTMAETVYDIKFAKTNNEFYATLHNTNVSSKNPKNMSFFKLETPNAGFLSNYVIQTNYEFANSTLIFNYSMFNISKETDLMTYVCHDWDLEIGKCMGVWSIIANAEQDKTNQIITAIVLNFSGFGIKEVANISSIVEARLNAPHSGSNGIIFPDKPTLPKELEIEENLINESLEFKLPLIEIPFNWDISKENKTLELFILGLFFISVIFILLYYQNMIK